jgi:hypothetical protein
VPTLPTRLHGVITQKITMELFFSIVKPTSCTSFSNLFLFCTSTLHVSDGLSVHHQESKTVHTASGTCQTDSADCLLAGTFVRGVGLLPLASWDCGFESRREPGCRVCFEYCVVSGSLCDGLFTRPEETYRVWCVRVIVKPRY